MKLNKQQQAVNKWVLEGEGDLNLVARAGCGKTSTLIRGVIRTLLEHVPPKGQKVPSIALMAYNKSASEEFKIKLAGMAEETGDNSYTMTRYVDPGTVHSFGFRMVRDWTRNKAQVDDRKIFKIINSRTEKYSDVYSLEGLAIAKLVSLAKQTLPAADHWNATRWAEILDHHGINDFTDHPASEVIAAAMDILQISIDRSNKVIDFDDMIFLPLVKNLKPTWKYDWVLIDEAQDTNPSRRELAFKLLKPDGRLIAVGDPKQAIYGFTGADHDAMDLIKEARGSAELPLTITYRCPRSVVLEANRLVPDLIAAPTAPEGTVRRIERLIKPVSVGDPFIPWYVTKEKPTPQDAVLCRNTAPIVSVAYGMIAAGIGCRIEGRDIGEGLVKLATKWKRIEGLDALNIRLTEYLIEQTNRLGANEENNLKLQSIADKVGVLHIMINSLVDQGHYLIESLVEHIRGMFGDTKPGEIPDVPVLSTIHKAKGREWERVFILYPSETMPSRYAVKDWQMEQEDNLLYTAITRTKSELIYVD